MGQNKLKKYNVSRLREIFLKEEKSKIKALIKNWLMWNITNCNKYSSQARNFLLFS